MYEPTIDVDVLKSEFRYVSMNINQNEVVSFPTLVSELNKQDTEYLWLAGKNFMTLVKIMLCVMPTSISAERSFSVLDRVKTKLHNSMGDKRMSNLMMLSFYPEMVNSIDIISLCNKFVSQTQYTSRRETLFRKFVEEDLIIESIKPKKVNAIEIISN